MDDLGDPQPLYIWIILVNSLGTGPSPDFPALRVPELPGSRRDPQLTKFRGPTIEDAANTYKVVPHS